MLDPATLAIVQALARGLDPSTGAALPAADACQQPSTIRALGALLVELQARAGGQERRRVSAAGVKAGLPWEAADEAALAEGFDRGASIAALAEQLQRTRGAIEARLVRLGKIEPRPGLRLREPAGSARDARP